MKPPDDTGLVWIRLPGKKGSLPLFREFVLKQAREADLSGPVQMKLDLVVEEVLLNVFHYAFEKGQTGDVAVGCGMVPEQGFVMRVMDPGRPFNPLEQPPPDTTSDVAERKVGGLGIFLTRKMSSALAYDRREDHNILDIFFNEPEDSPTAP